MSGLQQFIAIVSVSSATLVGVILQWVKYRRPIRVRKALSALRGCCPHWDLDLSTTDVKGLWYTSTITHTDKGITCWKCGHTSSQDYFNNNMKEWQEMFKEDTKSASDMYLQCIKRRNTLIDKFGRKGYSADEVELPS